MSQDHTKPQPAQAAQPDQASQANKPADTLQDGNVKASIWRNQFGDQSGNQSKDGAFYATTFSRTWRDRDGQYHDSHSFTGADLLKVSELARSAYHRTNALRCEDRQKCHEQNQEQDQAPQRPAAQNEFREKRQPNPAPNPTPRRDHNR